MIKKILGVVVGYVAVVIFIMATFSVLYSALGSELAYQPNSYEVSTLWVILSAILGLIAAVIGGFVCKIISQSAGTVKLFAGIVLVFGVVMGIWMMSAERSTEVRNGDVSNAEAMQKSSPPVSVLFLIPILGAIGILMGGSIRTKN